MPNREILLCTALPEAIDAGGLRIAVLISPRLTADTPADQPLRNWPDVADLPRLAPTWRVTITQEGRAPVELDAAEISGPYDAAAWDAMFPAEQPTTPYRPMDRSATPIFSYPVTMVRDAVRDMHTTAMTSARVDFPTVTALEEMPGFQALKRGLDRSDGDPVADMIEAQRRGPVPDADVDLAGAFVMAEGVFAGVRPGSVPPPLPPPTLTGVRPSDTGPGGGAEVTLAGSGFVDVTGVTFDGIPAQEVAVVSATTITCRTPVARPFDAPSGIITLVPVPVSVTTRSGVATRGDLFSFRYDRTPR